MIKRQNLEEQLRLFRELMDIMSAMKNLALTELRKLNRYLSTQERVVATIERAAKDFVSHHPLPLLPGEGDPLFLLGLTVLHHTHEGETGAEAIAAFRPIGPFIAQPRQYGTPPRLHLPPREFMGELIDQYVFAALHGAIYQSLMAENRWRLRQTEGALSRMEHRMREWQQRVNLLRQEEITEEIEEIMLSVEAIERPMVPGR